MQHIEKRAFGTTGLQVGAIGFGAAEIGFQQTTPKTVDALLGTALDAGINVVDTAAMYADSEEKIGRATVYNLATASLPSLCNLSIFAVL